MNTEQRELKFRAWLTPENSIVDAPTMVYQRDYSPGRLFAYVAQDKHPMMQFTGIQDRKGVDVYEGDIVRKFTDRDQDEKTPNQIDQDDRLWRDGTAQVVYRGFGFYMQEIDCGKWAFNGWEGPEWSPFEIEVIGNIYENPELLAQAGVEAAKPVPANEVSRTEPSQHAVPNGDAPNN